MAKHEAVDRLMALAMEKRADRIPDHAPPVRMARISAAEVTTPTVLAPEISEPGGLRLEPQQGPSAGERGRQFLQAIRPLLPAVAGAMRLVDHGAVQAVARLLPLLGGGSAVAGAQPNKSANADLEHLLQGVAQLQAAQLANRHDVDALTRHQAETDDLLGRTRTHLERVAAEQTGREGEVRSLSDRVRLLSAGLIILLMLIVAQMILLVVMLHK